MLAIISDTHDNIEGIETAVTMLRELAPELVVHCGDIASVEALSLFAGLPLFFVFGNCDSNKELLKARALDFGWNKFGDELEFDFKSKKFFAYHGFDSSYLDRKLQSELYDYVLTGHTHIQTDQYFGKTRLINPGAFERVEKYTFAALEPELDKLEFITVPY